MAARDVGPFLVVVDGNNLVHRTWHAQQQVGLSGAWVAGGLMRTVLAITRETGRPTHLAVAFDSLNNVRKVQHSHYKAQRSAADPDLYAQMDLTRQVLGAAGVAVITIDGWEADDVCASLAATATAAGLRTLVISGDRDLIGCVSDRVTLARPRSGGVADHLTPELTRKKYDVMPATYRDMAAMRGDTSDNLPGAKGVGPKTAVKLLEAHGTLDGILAAAADPAAPFGGTARIRGIINDCADTLRTNAEIMTLNADLPVDLDDCEVDLDHVAEQLADAGLRGAAASVRNLAA